MNIDVTDSKSDVVKALGLSNSDEKGTWARTWWKRFLQKSVAAYRFCGLNASEDYPSQDPTAAVNHMMKRCEPVFADLAVLASNENARKQLAGWKVRQMHKYDRGRMKQVAEDVPASPSSSADAAQIEREAIIKPFDPVRDAIGNAS